MKRALVTGASGFIGRQVLSRLVDRGYEVHAVSTGRPGLTLPSIQWHAGDLLEPEVPARLLNAVRPSHLLHLAWYAAPGRFWQSPQNRLWQEASVRIFDAFSRAGGERAVGVGTCAEYSWELSPFSERSTPLQPATPYGVSKAETFAALMDLSEARGFGAAWGRVFHLYGPYEPPERLVSSLIISLLSGSRFPCTAGMQLRDFLHVADTADALVALLSSDVIGPVNTASGLPVAVTDVVTLAAQIIGRSDLVDFGAIPAREGDPPAMLADVTRLREEVGWQPAIGLEEGLRDTVQWWRDRNPEERIHASG